MYIPVAMVTMFFINIFTNHVVFFVVVGGGGVVVVVVVVVGRREAKLKSEEKIKKQSSKKPIFGVKGVNSKPRFEFSLIQKISFSFKKKKIK